MSAQYNATIDARMTAAGYEPYHAAVDSVGWSLALSATEYLLITGSNGTSRYGDPAAPEWIVGRYLNTPNTYGRSTATGLTLDQALALIHLLPPPADGEILIAGADKLIYWAIADELDGYQRHNVAQATDEELASHLASLPWMGLTADAVLPHVARYRGERS
jgi:hypothetical protein